MTKPLLLLDVDGVCLPFGGYPSTAAFATRYESHDTNRIPESIMVHINELLSHFDVHWCTGWEHEANSLLAPLNGLPQLPVVELRGVDPYAVHWKLNAIIEYVGDRPFVFIDDDIGQEAIQWAEERSKNIPTLFIPVKCGDGINDEILQQALKWAERIESHTEDQGHNSSVPDARNDLSARR